MTSAAHWPSVREGTLEPWGCLPQGALAERGQGHASDRCRKKVQHRAFPRLSTKGVSYLSTCTWLDLLQDRGIAFIIPNGQLIFYTVPSLAVPFQVLIPIHRWFVGSQKIMQCNNTMLLSPFCPKQPLLPHQVLIMYVVLIVRIWCNIYES